MSRIVGMSYEKLFEKLESKNAAQILEVMEPFFREVATIDPERTCTFFVDQLRFDPAANGDLLFAAAAILSKLVHGIETRKTTAQYVVQLFQSFLAALSTTAQRFETTENVVCVEIEEKQKNPSTKREKRVRWNDEVYIINHDEEDQEAVEEEPEGAADEALRKQISDLMCELGLAHRKIADLEKQNDDLTKSIKKVKENALKASDMTENCSFGTETSAVVAELEEKLKDYARKIHFSEKKCEENAIEVEVLRKTLKASEERCDRFAARFENVFADLEAERQVSYQLKLQLDQGQTYNDRKRYSEYRNDSYTKKSRVYYDDAEYSKRSSLHARLSGPKVRRVLMQTE